MKPSTLIATITASGAAATALAPILSTTHLTKRDETDPTDPAAWMVNIGPAWEAMKTAPANAMFCVPGAVAFWGLQHATPGYVGHIFISAGYATGGQITSYLICTKLVGGGEVTCHLVGTIVASYIGAIYGSVINSGPDLTTKGHQGSATEDQTTGEGAKVTTRGELLSERVSDKIRALGYELEHVEVKSKRSIGEEAIHGPTASNTTTFHIRGLRAAGEREPNDVEITYDHVDGTGSVRRLASMENEKRGLTGPWFKVAFRTTKWVDPMPQWDDSVVQGMSYSISQEWANYMDAHQDMGRWYGKMEFGSSLHIEYQIIPEDAVAYTADYEDVTACGEAEIVPPSV